MFLSIRLWEHEAVIKLMMGLLNQLLHGRCKMVSAHRHILSPFLDVFQLLFAQIFLFLFVRLPLSFIFPSLND